MGADVERLNLRDGVGNLDGTGNALDNRINGNDGANILSGLDGSDRLYGEEGSDRLFGGNGNDRLYGGAGGDYLDGGLGNDTYYVDNADDVVIEGTSGGRDFIESDVTFVLSDNVERLRVGRKGADVNGIGNSLDNDIYGGDGNNTLWGMDGDDQINGGGGDDVMYGGNGNDRFNGNNGHDLLYGGAGDDRFDGGAGDDIFYGGLGANRMKGGDGADTFSFVPTPDLQMVDDFQQGVDIIEVSAVTFDDIEVYSRGRGVQVDFGTDHQIYLANTGEITLTSEDFTFI
jgi:Ca2+-binding RTX toxin-like protein